MVQVNGLKFFRNKLDKTIEEMAEILGVSSSYYAKIEVGQRNPSYNFLKKFKKKFPLALIDEIFFTGQLHD